MPPANPLTLLLANEQPEEIKLITVTMRRYYPGCRVEAVYSGEEALEWAVREDWHVILVDEQLPRQREQDILSELRRRSPNAAIIVLAEHDDVSAAVQAMRAGADFFLFKKSSVYLSELPMVTKEVLEKRELRARLALAQDRYHRLIEILGDVAYELDAEGRFTSVSPGIVPLLGYTPQELTGTHHSKLLPPDDLQKTARRFDERRTAERATRQVELRLVPKGGLAATAITVQVNAIGLYNQQQFLGTVGVLRSSPARPSERSPGQTASPGQISSISTVSPNAPPLRAPDTSPLLHEAQPLPKAERRRSPRLALRIEARLSLDGSAWNGTALNISLGGIFMVFDGIVPVSENQPIRLGLMSEVGVLEIRGTVRGIREVSDLENGPRGKPALGLAVQFTGLQTTEEMILTSLLDSLRDQPGHIKLRAMLTPQGTGDLLLEVSSLGADDHQTALHPDPSPVEENLNPERRFAARVKVSIPARVEPGEPSAPNSHSTAVTTNLSVHGACLRLQSPVKPLGRRYLVRLLPPPGFATQPAKRLADNPEYTVTGEIVWTAPEATEPADLKGGLSASTIRLGLRFLHFNDEGQRRLAELIGRFLTSPARLEDWSDKSKLVSELMECRNEKGQRIAVYHDSPRKTLPPGSPVVIISPGYGETKKEYITLAYYFADNGFHVLRYDHTDHVGESEGGIEHSTLSSMRQDLSALLSFAERTWPASPISVVATSLAGRVALKALAQDRRVKLLVLLTCIVDVQATLLAVHQEDLIGSYLHGVRRGVINLLGFNIDADGWLADASKEGYANLQTTIRDAGLVKIPVILFAAEQDTWVMMESVKEVQTALGPNLRHLYLIPEALHRLHENPRKARAVIRHLLACCLDEFYPLSPKAAIQEPSQREIGLQNRLERERARARHHMAKTDTVEFWRDYLSHFHYISNISDYWHLLDQIYSLMGRLDEGERILDAGCGNGNFGMFLLINQAYRQQNALRVKFNPPQYVGIDFVPNALVQARRNLEKVTADLQGKFPTVLTPHSLLRTSFGLVDLHMPLPFRDDQFDRIVCNLVLSYLDDPLFTLRELLRVLAPNGRLILTNLKPHADLSQVYRNFLHLAQRPEEVEEAKQLLNNSGRIMQCESNGIFRFFDKQELSMLLTSSGAVQPRIYSTFANQAYLAVAEKPGTMYKPQASAIRLPPQPWTQA
jgi:PAS domain S-box-containing protein